MAGKNMLLAMHLNKTFKSRKALNLKVLSSEMDPAKSRVIR
jgi:hypothetical protein